MHYKVLWCEIDSAGSEMTIGSISEDGNAPYGSINAEKSLIDR